MSDISSRALDRRQLIKAGAWAAPVIVLATAAPAAQSVDTRTYSGAALVGVPLSIDNEATAGLGKVRTHMEYRRNAFPYSDTINGSQIDVSAPAQLSVGWQIVAADRGDRAGRFDPRDDRRLRNRSRHDGRPDPRNRRKLHTHTGLVPL